MDLDVKVFEVPGDKWEYGITPDYDVRHGSGALVAQLFSATILSLARPFHLSQSMPMH
jgi:hypothetical protein